MKKIIIPFLMLVAFSCENVEVEKSKSNLDQSLLNSITGKSSSGAKQGAPSSNDILDIVNASLANSGLEMEAMMLEYYGVDQAGNTVFFNDRGNKQLSADFVPGDPRRGGDTDIKYLIDDTESSTASGLSGAQTNAAITASMDTWGNVTCSDGLTINTFGPVPIDFGFVQNIVGFGGNGGLFTDVMHAGFLPGAFFDAIAPNGGSFILGATFTLIWTSGGLPTDIDNNGKADVAFREIYYNDAFAWNMGATYDVETVSLHEAGHALSQGHFGKAFLSGNGKLHFSPRAVMNAAYSGVQTTIGATDNAGHCSNWASWPNN